MNSDNRIIISIEDGSNEELSSPVIGSEEFDNNSAFPNLESAKLFDKLIQSLHETFTSTTTPEQPTNALNNTLKELFNNFFAKLLESPTLKPSAFPEVENLIEKSPQQLVNVFNDFLKNAIEGNNIPKTVLDENDIPKTVLEGTIGPYRKAEDILKEALIKVEQATPTFPAKVTIPDNPNEPSLIEFADKSIKNLNEFNPEQVISEAITEPVEQPFDELPPPVTIDDPNILATNESLFPEKQLDEEIGNYVHLLFASKIKNTVESLLPEMLSISPESPGHAAIPIEDFSSVIDTLTKNNLEFDNDYFIKRTDFSPDITSDLQRDENLPANVPVESKETTLQKQHPVQTITDLQDYINKINKQADLRKTAYTVESDIATITEEIASTAISDTAGNLAGTAAESVTGAAIESTATIGAETVATGVSVGSGATAGTTVGAAAGTVATGVATAAGGGGGATAGTTVGAAAGAPLGPVGIIIGAAIGMAIGNVVAQTVEAILEGIDDIRQVVEDATEEAAKFDPEVAMSVAESQIRLNQEQIITARTLSKSFSTFESAQGELAVEFERLERVLMPILSKFSTEVVSILADGVTHLTFIIEFLKSSGIYEAISLYLQVQPSVNNIIAIRKLLGEIADQMRKPPDTGMNQEIDNFLGIVNFGRNNP